MTTFDPFGRRHPGRPGEGPLLLLPALLLLVFVVLVPIAMALWDSLHFRDLGTPARHGEWAGERHYRELVHDPEFLSSLQRSLRFAGVATAVELALGLPLALWLHGAGSRLRRFVELILLLPLLSAPVMVGLTWYLLLQADYGVIPWLFGLDTPLLASAGVAPWTLVWVDVWQWTPFVVLLVMAALDTVPRELREAATLDGLDRRTRFRAIELPYLAPVLLVVALLRFLEAFKLYDTLVVLTGGGPGDATKFISLFLTEVAFRQTRFGYASAATLLLDYLVIVAATVLFLLLTRKREGHR